MHLVGSRDSARSAMGARPVRGTHDGSTWMAFAPPGSAPAPGPRCKLQSRGRSRSRKISTWVTSSRGTMTVGMKNAAPSEPGPMPTPNWP